VVKVGDGKFKLGQLITEDDLLEENARLAKAGKRLIEPEPQAFYLTAWEEDQYIIAQANAERTDETAIFRDEARHRAQAGATSSPSSATRRLHGRQSPKQLVSVAASLIPFLEHDDANRALDGLEHAAPGRAAAASPMRRSWAPAWRAPSPATRAPSCSASAAGIVDWSTATRIVVRVEGEDIETGEQKEFGADIYKLTKFRRSNQNTCINQKPIVRQGDQRVQQGRGARRRSVTSKGELALGRNVLVAFMPWRGYNFEDAILSPRNLVKEDYYTSIHIEEFEIEAATPSSGRRRSRATSRTSRRRRCAISTRRGIIRIGASVKARRHPRRQGHAEGRDRAHARKRSCCGRSSARRPAT
jgi:DNA-directed RNA polymerase subunit beta